MEKGKKKERHEDKKRANDITVKNLKKNAFSRYAEAS